MKAADLTGMVFERLTVLERCGSKGNHAAWLCRCECGKETIAAATHLKLGYSKSCGCRKRDLVVQRFTTHGETKSLIYSIYYNIRNRCTNPKHSAYHNYGGRGIGVCDRWMGDGGYERFRDDMGPRPSPRHTVDRIDNDKGYSPENCRWATRKEQCNNTRQNTRITHSGETLTVTQWADKLGISRGMILARIKRGWAMDSVLTPKKSSWDRRGGRPRKKV